MFPFPFVPACTCVLLSIIHVGTCLFSLDMFDMRAACWDGGCTVQRFNSIPHDPDEEKAVMESGWMNV